VATSSKEAFHLGAARVVGSSPKALHVELEASSVLGARKVWVPRSVIHDDSEVFDALNNGSGDLAVVEWFARKEGWQSE